MKSNFSQYIFYNMENIFWEIILKEFKKIVTYFYGVKFNTKNCPCHWTAGLIAAIGSLRN